MNNFVFPIYKSNTVNAYRNTFGQFDKDSLEKKGNFDFCLREEKSGKFVLERITEGKVPNAHRMTVICPHHDQHRMTAIDNHTFIALNVIQDSHTNTGGISYDKYNLQPSIPRHDSW